MIKIGITGGIGSGKSIVSSLLVQSGVPVYTADSESKQLTNISPVIQKSMKEIFGDDIYINDKLDGKRLASLIFSNEALLKKVNEIIHPVVREDFLQWVSKQTTEFCAIESAILYESEFDNEVDVVLMVYAPVELRLTRAMMRDSATEAEIMRRMNRQMSDDLKRKQADFVIINDERQELKPQIEQFMKTVRGENVI